MHRVRVRPRLIAAGAVAALGVAAIVTVSNASQAASSGCRVDYRVSAQWPGGLLTAVTVTNLGAAVDGWRVSWSAPGGQRVLQGWNADVRQSGGTITARDAGWNRRLATGGSARFGFVAGQAAGTVGTTVLPSAFTLNGMACNGPGDGPGNGPGAPTAPPTGAPTSAPPSGTPTTARPTRTTTPTAAPTATPTTVAPTSPGPAAPTTSVTQPAGQPGGSGPYADIPEGYRVVRDAAPNTVRVFFLKPSDVKFDKRWPDGIAKVVQETQQFYKAEMGKTITLNKQIVEVIPGDHPQRWYETTPNGDDKYFWAVFNMSEEIHRKLADQNIDQWVNIAEVEAEGDGGGGGGGNGWVILNQHDADGAAGVRSEPMGRWYGGMAHELGHALGLPDSTYTDGTPMSASFYGYPNCHFTQQQKQGILTGPWARFMS